MEKLIFTKNCIISATNSSFANGFHIARDWLSGSYS